MTSSGFLPFFPHEIGVYTSETSVFPRSRRFPQKPVHSVVTALGRLEHPLGYLASLKPAQDFFVPFNTFQQKSFKFSFNKDVLMLSEL
jgi:hypothetical protein